MTRVHPLTIIPKVPEKLSDLLDLGSDLTWTWTPEAGRLFEQVDPALWSAVNHNPIALLGQVGSQRLAELAGDKRFLKEVKRVKAVVKAERASNDWFSKTHPKVGGDAFLVAYFSAEYGLTEALPIYSGGLGVLSGDHLKSSSCLGLPLVAVGLAYHKGYFRQRIDEQGWQNEEPYENDFHNLPMGRAARGDGERLEVSVNIEGRNVQIQVWEVTVGGVRLFLLDTDVADNHPDDREITASLYGGGSDMRLRQEVVLGVGGFRALDALGLRPTVFHMNEGHSSFMALERIRQLRVSKDLDFRAAREFSAQSNVFTTHTPVPAGFDIFGRDQMDRFLPDLHHDLGLSREELLALGAHENDPNLERGFNMAYLALRCAAWVNGVSALHGQVSRGMWAKLWPGLEADEVPITSVTNGVHTRTWLSPRMGHLLTEELGPWEQRCADPAYWEQVTTIDDAKLWAAHSAQRAELVNFVRHREQQKFARRGMTVSPTGSQVGTSQAFSSLLDPDVLTIGFARRFATYKRATLLMRDPERLERLITNSERPVQFVFAGKAHPKDVPGKKLIAEIMQFAQRPAVRGRVAFIEEYDMGVGRRMVQGVDVWLNTPRRPKEASGTSGMKVVMNGGIHLSVLDGWWVEAYAPELGFSIGLGEKYSDVEFGDAAEAELLMTLLERQLVPEFYDRDANGLSRRWVQRMKLSMSRLSPMFAMDRQVMDYTNALYVPAHGAARRVSQKDGAEARIAADRLSRLRRVWPHAVTIEGVHIAHDGPVSPGEAVRCDAWIELAGLSPDDVRVQIVASGRNRAVPHRQREVLELEATPDANELGHRKFSALWKAETAGRVHLTVRLQPNLSEAPVRDLPVILWE